MRPGADVRSLFTVVTEGQRYGRRGMESEQVIVTLGM